jgi:hypothetical protein
VCRLVVADAVADDGPRSLYLLARWFHAVVSLSGAGGGLSCARVGTVLGVARAESFACP